MSEVLGLNQWRPGECAIHTGNGNIVIPGLVGEEFRVHDTVFLRTPGPYLGARRPRQVLTDSQRSLVTGFVREQIDEPGVPLVPVSLFDRGFGVDDQDEWNMVGLVNQALKSVGQEPLADSDGKGSVEELFNATVAVDFIEIRANQPFRMPVHGVVPNVLVVTAGPSIGLNYTDERGSDLSRPRYNIKALNLPPGATFRLDPVENNEKYVFRWTPTEDQVDRVFTATFEMDSAIIGSESAIGSSPNPKQSLKIRVLPEDFAPRPGQPQPPQPDQSGRYRFLPLPFR